jgi:LysR family glycine cleavage system transcriptional activator
MRLRAFEAAARCLSFTRAAEELFVTQSAVSKQVIALESALGVPLFERRPRALLLTPAGERLQRAVSWPLPNCARWRPSCAAATSRP